MSLIKNNLSGELRQHLKQSPCVVSGRDANLRVRTFRRENGYYPDVMVCCDPGDDEEYYREKPVVIAEIVSETSRITDRTLKKSDYFTLPSLREYLAVEQDRMEVTVYRRLQDGWEEEICTGGDVVRLRSLGFACPIGDVYLKVGLPA